jgi:hypothetical protein
VYNISKKFHQGVETSLIKDPCSTDTVERHLIKATLKSIPIMKSQIGSFYYMEGKAKLTLLHNVVRGIAFMMVTFK